MLPDRYDFIGELGHGAFATVYKAYDNRLSRFVAIKMLKCALEGPMAQRFQREVEICQRLRHDNIVRLYDADLTADQPYMVLELLDGRPLDTLLGPGAFTVDEARGIVAQIAWALDYVHANDLLHRDIKPENIMLVSGGRAVLTDFNLSLDVQATALSATGQVFGTPRYMAPELWDGAHPSAASDIYSLGLVLYELLTDRDSLARCFTDGSKVVTLAPLPAAILESAPWLASIIVRATAVDPSARYRRARRFARALNQESLSGMDRSMIASRIRARDDTSQRRRWQWLPLALLGAATLFGGIYYGTRLTAPAGEAYVAVDGRALRARLETVDLPSVGDCTLLGKMVSNDDTATAAERADVTRVIREDASAARGLYVLAKSALSKGQINGRDWALYALLINRHGRAALTKAGMSQFFTELAQAAVRSRQANEGLRLLESLQAGRATAPAVAIITAACLQREDVQQERAMLQSSCRLIQPLLFLQPPVAELEVLLQTYLSCIAHLLDEAAKGRLELVMSSFVERKRAGRYDRYRCLWRSVALWSLGWEPSQQDLQRSIAIVEAALTEAAARQWYTELRCLLALLHLRPIGGAINPPMARRAQALAVMKQALAEATDERTKNIARAMYATTLIMIERYEEADEVLAAIDENSLGEDDRWWVLQARAWRLADPTTRAAAIEAFKKTKAKAPPELRWYYEMLCRGMDASRLLDHFFDQ